jgi:hypothetical protein
MNGTLVYKIRDGEGNYYVAGLKHYQRSGGKIWRIAAHVKAALLAFKRYRKPYPESIPADIVVEVYELKLVDTVPAREFVNK